MSNATFGNLRIEFTAREPGSVIMEVRAKVTARAELDKLIAALSVSRDLLPEEAVEG